MLRKGMTLLTAVLLIVGGIFAGVNFSSRPTVNAKESDGERKRDRIGYVNISEVLKGFTRANTRGLKLGDLRQTYVQEVGELRNKLSQMNAQLGREKDEKGKEELRDSMTKIQRKIEDIERNAQKELNELSNKTIIDVHNEIAGMVAEIAREHDLDCIMSYPGSPHNEIMTHNMAQLVLQTPAAYPMYMKPELNFTAETLQRLNKKYPSARKHED